MTTRRFGQAIQLHMSDECTFYHIHNINLTNNTYLQFYNCDVNGRMYQTFRYLKYIILSNFLEKNSIDSKLINYVKC